MRLASDSEPSFITMMNSTKAYQTFGDLASDSNNSTLDMTQNKIETYRKVLEGLKNKTEVEDKIGLMTAWTKHRESLSPRVDKVKRRVPSGGVNLEQSPAPSSRTLQQSPLLTPASPGQDLITSRLDQLMTSLTLTETNQAEMNLSLGDDLDLLSPHL